MNLNKDQILLNKVVQSMPGNLYWKDREGRYLGCNDNQLKVAKLSNQEDIIGKTDFDLYHFDLAKKVSEVDEQVMSSANAMTFEEQGFNAQGQAAIYLTDKQPLLNEKNEICGVIGVSIDITSQKIKLHSNLTYDFCEENKTIFFTPRELDVFKYIIFGLTSKQIAKRLGLSFRTIEDYVEKIKIKLGCTSKSQITEAAISLGLIRKMLP